MGEQSVEVATNKCIHFVAHLVHLYVEQLLLEIITNTFTFSNMKIDLAFESCKMEKKLDSNCQWLLSFLILIISRGKNGKVSDYFLFSPQIFSFKENMMYVLSVDSLNWVLALKRF